MGISHCKYSIILLIILVVSECGQKPKSKLSYIDTGQNGKIEFDLTNALLGEPSIVFDDMIDSIKIIPLETITPSLVSERISSICFSPQNIFVNDHRNVIIFTQQGKFVKTLEKGQGPNEVGFPEAMSYDEKNGFLYVYDGMSRKIMKYTQGGDYLSYHVVNAIIRDLSVSDTLTLIAQHGRNGIFAISIGDTIGNFHKYFVMGEDTYPFVFDKYILPFNGGFNIKKLLDNKIYIFRNDSIYAKFSLKYPVPNIDFSQYRKLSELESTLQKGEFLFTGNFIETNDYLFTIFRTNGFRTKELFTNKKTGRSICRLFNPHSLISCIHLDIDHILISNDNWFLGIIRPEIFTSDAVLEEYRWDGSNPNNLISDEDMAKLKAVKPDDNPIIVLFKLKDDI